MSQAGAPVRAAATPSEAEIAALESDVRHINQLYRAGRTSLVEKLNAEIRLARARAARAEGQGRWAEARLQRRQVVALCERLLGSERVMADAGRASARRVTQAKARLERARGELARVRAQPDRP